MLTRLRSEAIVYRAVDLLEDAYDALESVLEEGDADAFGGMEWARIREAADHVDTALRRLKA